MKVWLVNAGAEYEDTVVICAYDTMEGAMKYIEELKKYDEDGETTFWFTELEVKS